MAALLSRPLTSNDTDESAHWLSVSDLMAGLMMVFLFISIALIRQALIEKRAAEKEAARITGIAEVYAQTRKGIYERLVQEFSADLVIWDADIDEDTLAFNFRSPDVLFQPGNAGLQRRFRAILDDFFPRYVAVLREFDTSIVEVRIEGYTSSEWRGARDEAAAYFNNMTLSQGRTRSVLQYGHRLPELTEQADWIKKKFSAVGYSSARLVKVDGIEDPVASRRVSFRPMTNAEKKIFGILEQS